MALFSILNQILGKKKHTTKKVATSTPAKNKPVKSATSIAVNAKKVEDKCIADYVDILSDNDKEYAPTELVSGMYDANEQPKVGFVVLGTKSYVSDHAIKSLTSYAKTGVRIVLLLDKTIKKNEALTKLIKGLLKQSSVSVAYFSRLVTHQERIAYGINLVNTQYVCMMTMLDFCNVRSTVQHYIDLAEQYADKVAIVPFKQKSDISFLKSDTANRWCGFDVSELSGILFNSKKLLEIMAQGNKFDSWLPFILFNHIASDDIEFVDDKYSYISREKTTELSVPDIAFYIKNSLTILNSLIKSDENHVLDKQVTVAEFVDIFIQGTSVLYHERQQTAIKTTLLASGSALFVATLKEVMDKDSFADVLYRCSAIFEYDQLLKVASLQSIHQKIIKQLIPVAQNTIGVIETDFMEDLKHCLLPDLQKSYNVIYITKPQYYDYHFFNCLVMRALLQPAEYILSSNDMHRFITGGKTVVTIWHGSGMLKKIAEADRVKYPMNYIVTSSPDCVQPWSETFKLPEDHVLPLGQVQMDIMFDEQYKKDNRQAVCTKYQIPQNAKIIFFAPTFRNGESNKYYDFGMDIDEVANELANRNIYLITKKHHVFEHIYLDKGIDTSGVKNSQNGHFIVANSETFTELLSASDMFITDYSSGIFYALAIDMPIVLYAPDVVEYKEGLNGFMIDYPEALPFPFCGEPNIAKFLSAIDDADKYVTTVAYKEFKKIHVSACDGHVKERIFNFLSTWNGKNFGSVNE